jgi:quercetin dioxygenase-like cupin family protein
MTGGDSLGKSIIDSVPQSYRCLMVEVERLSDAIGFQPKSVVSRTLIDKEKGTVTLFAFDEGEGLSEHTAPYDALVYVYDGRASIVISGEPYEVGEGETIIMPADEPHALRALTPFKMMLVMIRS